jgi:hypothetical protein
VVIARAPTPDYASGGQRFVGASQAGETRGERPQRLNYTTEQSQIIFSLHRQAENESGWIFLLTNAE